jgi:hypothetical protein
LRFMHHSPQALFDLGKVFFLQKFKTNMKFYFSKS